MGGVVVDQQLFDILQRGAHSRDLGQNIAQDDVRCGSISRTLAFAANGSFVRIADVYAPCGERLLSADSVEKHPFASAEWRWFDRS